MSVRRANGTDYEKLGQIEFVDNQADPQTGTVTESAIFANPGQFVTLSIEEREAPTMPIVPQAAVLQDREGRFVYILSKDNTVSLQRIKTSTRIDNGWAVTARLKGGEQLVVQGIQRLADGMTVQPSAGQPVGGNP